MWTARRTCLAEKKTMKIGGSSERDGKYEAAIYFGMSLRKNEVIPFLPRSYIASELGVRSYLDKPEQQAVVQWEMHSGTRFFTERSNYACRAGVSVVFRNELPTQCGAEGTKDLRKVVEQNAKLKV